MQTTIPWDKIESLEKEIKALKALGKPEPKTKKKAKLKKDPLFGILKDAKISDEEFEKYFREAKKSLFP
mgnify:CR=1 FL=1